MNVLMQAIEQIGLKLGEDRVHRFKDISAYTTLKTKTQAEYFVEVRSVNELISVMNVVFSHTIPFFFMGGGSNIAILTDVIPGLVIRNIASDKKILNQSDTYVDIQISSGYSMTRLAKELAEMGLEGLEYHFGLPGTLGGAVYMNSKWTNPDSYVGDSLISGRVIDVQGKIKEVKADYFKFRYGYSALQETKEILVNATFRLHKKSPEVLLTRTREALEYRNKTQPKGLPTSGCFFKNITEEDQKKIQVPTKSAGYLIDQSGLKNFAVGEYFVSDKHANFIMNKGGGTPEDLRTIVTHVKETVKAKFGIELREEVIIL